MTARDNRFPGTRNALAWGAALLAAAGMAQAQIKYAGCADLAASQFVKKVVLNRAMDPTLEEPTKLAFLPDGRILFIQRRGPVKILKPGIAAPVMAWNQPVFWEKPAKDSKIEDGTLGVAVDPGFASNHFIYLYYSPPGKLVNRLSRFTMNGDIITPSTEKMLLEVETQRDYCCHTGGAMGFDAAGNLYLTTGDNTRSNDAYGAVDERPGYSWLDAQRSSGNTNDLRGKLLRIHPESDGTYSIPEGNLFAKGLARTRPEIYSMGHRNPYTMKVDKYTGWVQIGEVGPDADNPSPDKGPAQHEEFNLVKRAGNFGWPYFIGNNLAYNDYDYVAGKTGPLYNAAAPVNNSVNNTGLDALPPAMPAMLSREFGKSGKTVDGVEKFPNFQGTTAITGPVYYYDGKNPSTIKFPPHFDRKWLLSDFHASYINLATMDANWEKALDVARMPLGFALDRPISFDFGPDGALYVIEYAAGDFSFSSATEIVRIEYTGDCRPATPVPPEPPTALSGHAPGPVRALAAFEGGMVRLPAGLKGFSLYDPRGTKVWAFRRRSAEASETVKLPAALGRGLLKIRPEP
ncbi:MAG TPA: PQQ-dependent sugar dehydrogenase [Fibrobacteria bacterium]|nr:PQQ-dependent sugar dehydrogenase [Fibrobacteria bacterium]